MSRTQQLLAIAEDCATDLGLTPPFTAEEFAHALQRTRGYIIRLEPFPKPESRLENLPTGICCFVDGIFFAYYYASGSKAQQERIQYHELGHLLMGHVTPNSTAVLLREGVPLTEQERVTEAFAEAMMLYARYGDPRRPSRGRRDGGDDPLKRFLRDLDAR